MNTIGKNISKFRRLEDLYWHQLAKKTGISEARLLDIAMNPNAVISLGELQEIAHAMNTSVVQLLRGTRYDGTPYVGMCACGEDLSSEWQTPLDISGNLAGEHYAICPACKRAYYQLRED